MKINTYENTLLYSCLLFLFLCNNLFSQKCSDANKLIIELKSSPYEIECDFIKSFESALNDCLKDKEHSPKDLGNLYHKLGAICYNCDFFHKASQYAQSAIQIRKNNPSLFSNEDIGHSHYLLGIIQNYQRKYSLAIDPLEESIPFLLASNSPEGKTRLGKVYSELGDTYKNLEDYHQSLFYSQKAEKIIDQNDIYDVIALKSSLGWAYNQLGQNAEALDKYNSLLKLIESKGKQSYIEEYANVYNDLSDFYFKQKEYSKAENLIDTSIKNHLKNTWGVTINLIIAYSTKVEILIASKKISDADQLINETISLALAHYKSPYFPLVGKLYYLKGEINHLQNKESRALESYQKAIHSLVPLFQPASLSENPNLKNQLVGDKKELRAALYLKAKSHFQIFEKNKNLKDLIASHKTYMTLDTLITQTRQSFLAVKSKYVLQEKIVPTYEDAIMVAKRLFDLTNDPTYKQIAFDFIARNKAIILIEGLQNEVVKSSIIPEKLISQETELNKTIYELGIDLYLSKQSGNKDKFQEIQDELFEQKRDYEKLIQSFEKDFPDYYQLKYDYYPDISIEEIQSQLENDRAVIEFFVGEKTLYTSVISNDVFEIFSTPISKNFKSDCDKFIKITRGEVINNSHDYRFSKISHDLFNLLINDAQELLNSSIKRLTIIPDDILLHLPFDVLLTHPYENLDKWYDANIPFLIKKYALSQVYASSLLFDQEGQRKIEKAEKGFVGFGIDYIDFSNQQPTTKLESDIQKRINGPLLHAIPEVEGIEKIVDGDILVNRDATKVFFLENAHQYGLIHFAVHGFANEENELGSSLILGDEKDYQLRVANIYSMDQKLNAELIVLSACQTNHGTIRKGEGMRTLSRAFAFAGCPSIIASSWNIPDKSSKEIFISFYEEFINNNQPKDVALQLAKMKYLENVDDGNDALMQKWALTTVIGDVGEYSKSGNSRNWYLYLGMGILLLIFMGILRRKS